MRRYVVVSLSHPALAVLGNLDIGYGSSLLGGGMCFVGVDLK